MTVGGTHEAAVRDQAHRAPSSRYCWVPAPVRGTGFGGTKLSDTLRSVRSGALTPRVRSFWHDRLGLADPVTPPLPPPTRRNAHATILSCTLT